MRLTLRTLLAYMDDILEPAQAKEIGKKLVQSDSASTLSARIKDVMRRRRVSAPDIDGPGAGVDPNTVSQYLDNTLPPEAVADIERIFLKSDIHLAEVASSHQILTLALGEPIDINPDSRERMYALGPEPYDEDPVAAAMETPAPAVAPAAATAAPETQSRQPATPASFHDTLPPQLRRKPFFKRILPFVIVLAIGGAFAGVVLTDPSLLQYFSSDSDEDGQPSGDQIAKNDIEKTDAKTDLQQRKSVKTPTAKSRGNQIANRKKAGKSPIPPLPAGVNRTAPPDVPEPGKGKVVGKTSSGKKPKIVDPKPPIPVAIKIAGKKSGVPAKKGSQPKAPRVVAGNAPKMQYEIPSGKGLLLRYAAKDKDWFVIAANSRVYPGDVLAAPAPFDSFFDIANGRCKAVFQGGTAVTLLPPNAVATFGFDVRRGRVVLKSQADPKAKGAQAGHLVIGLKVHGRLYRLELLTPGTVCGIDIAPIVPTEFEKIPTKDLFTGGITVSTGSVRFSHDDRNVALIAGTEGQSGFLSLKPADLKANTGKWTTAVKQMKTPDWLMPDVRQRTVSVTRFSVLYLKEFEIDMVTRPPKRKAAVPRISMLENVPAIVRDRRAPVSLYAVRALAITESRKELVRALFNAKHEESRRAAIDGLRNWIPLNPKDGRLLKEELRAVFPQADADVVYRLLWGYTKKDARDETTSFQLVDWLNHSQIAVRELAYLHVHQLANRRDDYGYRPNLSAYQLRVTVNRWRKYVDKHGGLLPKKMKD